MSIALNIGDPSADVRSFRKDPEQCDHATIRYPQRLPKIPGQDSYCPECGWSQARPKWMDRFSPEELRSLQAMAEIQAVWLDYIYGEISQKIAYQRVVALTQVHQLAGNEEGLQNILDRLRLYV